MREIEFRGKLSHSKQWVYGNLIIANNGDPYIIPFEVFEPDGHHLIIDSDNPFWVEPESVGQFTGLLDNNGKKIFEGDILQSECTKVLKSKIDDDLFKIPNIEKRIYNNVIDWYNGVRVSGWRIKGKWFQTQLKWSTVLNMNLEIIGNVTDNPELLK